MDTRRSRERRMPALLLKSLLGSCNAVRLCILLWRDDSSPATETCVGSWHWMWKDSLISYRSDGRAELGVSPRNSDEKQGAQCSLWGDMLCKHFTEGCGGISIARDLTASQVISFPS